MKKIAASHTDNTTGQYPALLQRFAAGDFAGVKTAARRMLKHYPDDGNLWHLLGVACLQTGDNMRAEAALQRAGKLFPENAQIQEQRGMALCQLARYPLATQCFERGLTIAPEAVSIWSNAAKNANLAGCFAEAARYARQAVALYPANAFGYCNLGNALKALGQSAEAADSYRRAIEISPMMPEAHNNLGTILSGLGQIDAARACYLQAIERNPRYVDAYNNLANTFGESGHIDAASACYLQAIELNPRYADAHNNFGTILADRGRLQEAAAHYRQALELEPDKITVHSNLLFCLSHDETVTPAALFAEHAAFGERFAAVRCTPHANSREPLRRLRLGFVSGDLRDHPVASFIAPVWAALDLAQVEIWAYSTHAGEDRITEQLRAQLHATNSIWRQVARLNDDELAAQIRADGIDVLFDLSGHTADNRLLTFARKPAPVQVTWIGYPNTTGLQAMDYVLCDRFNAPHGLYEHFYVEKFARLPSSGTFAAETGAPPPNALPALEKGHVTFGSFNRANKLGDQVIAAWSRVLRAVPGACLLLGNVSDATLTRHLAERFGRHGIAPEQLIFRPRVPLHDYLALHHEVDIILDTWPYSGGTTTNHALWMGVPVVAQLGPTRAHCQSAAVLGRLGLEDWVARDVDAFVRLAVHWANSPQELARLRAGMRERWHTAPLRQPATVARGLEQAVRVMWQRWCAGLAAGHFEIGPDAVFESPGVH